MAHPLYLPKELFVADRSLCPVVPIHPLVVDSLVGKYGYRPFASSSPRAVESIVDDFPDLFDAFLTRAAPGLARVAKQEGRDFKQFYARIDHVGLKKADGRVIEGLSPHEGEPYLLHPMFSMQYRTYAVQLMLGRFSFGEWEPGLGRERVARLDELLPLYANAARVVTLVETHQAPVSRFDQLLGVEWALAVNNTVLSYLQK